jgi:hypothetical protein
MTGITSRIIQFGLLPLLRKADYFQALRVLQALLERSLLRIFAQFSGQAVHFNTLEKFRRFRAHHGLETAGGIVGRARGTGFVFDDFALFTGASPPRRPRGPK